MAAVTERIRLMTYLTVVPYRNPFLNAKSMTAVDVLSGGRTTFALGTGYLRSEFAALGVDFDERNELFDEAVEVMRAIWSTDELHYEGKHFKAIGVTMSPNAVQKPHPPLWIGGNAKVVRERVAQWGQGWAPLLGGESLFRTTRTRAIQDDEDLATLIAQVRDRAAELGRDPTTLDFACGSMTPLPRDASDAQRVDAIGALADIGVTWTSAPFPRSSFTAALDGIRAYGANVVAKAR
jgi:probable F420-dependent oxidoreductase